MPGWSRAVLQFLMSVLSVYKLQDARHRITIFDRHYANQQVLCIVYWHWYDVDGHAVVYVHER